ncbi:DsbA family oxidoreductase [Caulobacter mirabilis]|uniref:Disulfide bond formation protein DsbA n=1 Tax=Caulobacter mirabilis TaxID=69666 RepID=A0A2D2AYG9_9CAUL|nr:DsbA family oxidoreductase [Caulobacter mirabilis]ATQ43033.1 disulfide bond formation protein DsbA [Caulobacter mirabilis]
MQIDFIADVVCPWCYLGWRRLQKALEMRPDIQANVVWRPYQLDPTLPEEGVDRKAYMAAKFPDAERREAMGKILDENAAQDGVVWDMRAITVSPNTNAAHRVIRWAQAAGCQEAVLEGVLKAYFSEGKDIGDPVVLADIAGEAGMDRLIVLKLLSEGADKDVITREHQLAHQAGVSGVPFMIFDGKVAVSGAEPAERLVRALDKAVEMAG